MAAATPIDLVPPALAPVTLAPPPPPPPIARVDTPPAAPSEPPMSSGRLGTVIGGLVTVGAGIASTTWGVVEAESSGAVLSCAFACDSGSPWLRMFNRGSLDTIGGTGPAIAPFGLSLVTAGTVVAICAWLFDDSGDLPWISIVSGVVIGATMYGVFEAVGDQAPVLRGVE